MHDDRAGQIAVIFVSHRNHSDAAGYADASVAMEALAACQPGYRGMVGVRNAEGLGITVSYWADEAAAIAWRHHPGHAAIREAGRARWYDRYDLEVVTIGRSYGWQR